MTKLPDNIIRSSMAPSFFKILENPSAPHFILPPEFVGPHMGSELAEDLVTLTATGGRSWILKIEQVGESYRFTNGWKQVVKDIPLGYWETLVFHLVDEYAFSMTVYSRNGCELLLPVKKEPYDDDDERVYDECENVIVIEDDEEEKESDNVEGDVEKNEASVTETTEPKVRICKLR
ncbi:B3 domain-containing protein At5g18000-like [Bidens hawaiensis]|uniref:B3 domain-containing protein At5g18000-like n=1 Tax=Bidens hawaiensis TaxID=980011 RepID=UPI00404A7F5B